MHPRQKLALYFFGRSMDRAMNAYDFVLLAHRARRFDRRYVANMYFRPTGFAWKKAFKKPRRQPVTDRLNQIILTEFNADDQLSILGLRYRISRLSADDQQAVRGLDVDQILDCADDNSDACFDLMLLLHAVQDWGGLAKASEAILARDFSDTDTCCLAADMLVQARYQLVETKIFKNTITEDDVSGLKASLAVAEIALGESHSKLDHYRGLLSCVSGDLEQAVRLHAGADANTGYSTQFFRAASNVISFEEMKKFDQPAGCKIADHRWRQRHTGHSECTLLSTDFGYFDNYFEGFLESFSLVNPDGLVHMHAVGFEPEIAIILELEQRFGVHVNITYDPQSISGLSPDMFKGYCAGARYMFLPQYLARYDRVIIHDIDGVVETSMASVWKDREDSIIISSLVPEHDRRAYFAFWSNIGAGAFAIGANAANRKFAETLSGYLHSRFEVCRKTGGRFFFTDQVGLLLAILAFAKECEFVRMPAIFRQSSETRGQQRGQAKLDAQKNMLKKLRQAGT